MSRSRALIAKPAPKSPLRSFVRAIKTARADGVRVVLVGAARDTRFIARQLHKAQIETVSAASWAAATALDGPAVATLEMPVDRGWKGHGMLAVAAADVLGSRALTADALSDGGSSLLADTSELRLGDVVIHEDFGIGRISGLEALPGDDGDAFVLDYAAGARRLVPVADADRIWRYGADAEAISLDRLDGSGWQKRRGEIDAAIAESARGLTALAAARGDRKCPAIKPDVTAYERFVAGFRFTETPDQLRAIAAVRDDLAGGCPMDRLIVGDVGYGKTEVALRAAAMVAARGFDLPGATTARMIEAIIAGYIEGLADRAGANDDDQPAPVRKLLRAAGRRRWKHLAEERIEDVRPVIPLGSKYWPMTEEENRLLREMLASETIAGQWRSVVDGSDDTALELLDAAYWMKGCSSLSRLRYAAIVRLGADGPPALLDIKEATKAAAPRDAHAEMPHDNAMRVVTGARALSPHLGERMIAGRLGNTAVVIRELMPQDLKTELDDLTADEAQSVARSLASIVGRAHGRQLDSHQRTEWAADLARQRSKSLDAPTWLWTSVVELVGVHETAYLEHCRRALLAA